MATRCRRLELAVLALVLTLVPVAAGAKGAGVRLPRDHFAHPEAGIEWWYATGLVRGRDGHRYSVFFTLFRRAGFVLPISQVIDLGTGAIVGHSERLARAAPGTTKLDTSAGGGRLRYQPASDTWRFSASAAGYGLELVLRPEKPYVLHGGGGVIQTPAGPSPYYSATRTSARGTITTGGRDVPFTGTAWLDHQWGSFQDDPRAFNWDWFSCRFDDRTELMLYRFRDRRGRPLAAYRNGTYVPAGGRGRAVSAFTIRRGSRVLTAAGHRWPLDWQLRVPSEHLTVSVRSIVRNQLFRGVLVPTFWEAAATASGTKTGVCFVEETFR